MTSTRLATVAAVAALAVAALGGTALAVGADDTPTAVGAVSTMTSAASTPSPSPGSPPAEVEHERERAAAAALDRIGGGRITGVEQETEHGRTEWKVEIVDGGVEHDVRVDAATGAVTRLDADRDGPDDRRGGTGSGGSRSSDDGSSDDGPGHDGPGHDVGDDHGGDRHRGGDDD